MAKDSEFARGLSEDFMGWLEGPLGTDLLRLFNQEGLDLRLRENNFNVYDAQCSVARVYWLSRNRAARLSIHPKYLVDSRIRPVCKSTYSLHDISAGFLAEFAAEFPRIRKTVASSHHGKEGTWATPLTRSRPVLLARRGPGAEQRSVLRSRSGLGAGVARQV